ncbi:MAG: EamA family transporter RarD [Alphaproteobacteria bacterium]|nr:EamA family transporter RarD [Alphaproteobacteria bacterium]MDE2014450.1 EamA family transporter RarD [Alphaproteobacteria bacterium]MDE2074972.1 EamA family transporter RarD [Alphaproteobacteria bacterium]MDE2350827.1 EamA family transporter RarD [Alphaproteobacteria bacterium]
MNPPSSAVPDERIGIGFGILAYGIWGVLPLYWHVIADVPPVQITAFRILFCAVFLALVAAARGRFSRLAFILTTPSLFRRLALTAALIAANWTIYVYAISSGQLVEASLGYYILPLLSIALGVLLFGERLSRFRLAAILLAAGAVTVQTVALGRLPWIALALALSFGFYGYFRKLTEVDPLDGLLVETLVLLPVVLGVMIYWGLAGRLAFTLAAPQRDLMLTGAGLVTAVPLTLFAAAARRIRLSTLGFLQYLSPSISLVIAILLFGEAFTLVNALTFGCVWSALLLVAAEGQVGRLRARRLAGE